MRYFYKKVEYSQITKDANGKFVGSKSVFTHETDSDGNVKEPTREDYELSEDGKWARLNSTTQNAIENNANEKKNQCAEDCGKACAEPFKDGDILKEEHPTYNVYLAYRGDKTAYWVLITSLTPGKNQFLGLNEFVDLNTVCEVTFDSLKKATRDEVFGVERFIEANIGYRWDWRNKILAKA